jgi:hypothetical protein
LLTSIYLSVGLNEDNINTGRRTIMAAAFQGENLHYRNQEFAIHHLIDDCPPATVIRELLKNAEENALQRSVPGRIEWFVEEIDGVPKLGLYNEGPGMGDEELFKLMDLASTGKKLGIGNNFGQGGKISALKVSPHGVVYRSCKAGKVSQVLLTAQQQEGADFPVYVKIPQSSQVHADRNLDQDWTEVILLGRDGSHNTVNNLLPEMTHKNWLMRLINTRFFRFSEGVLVRAANITTGSVESRAASGLEQLTGKHSEKREDVKAEHPRFGPVVIRYCKLRGQYGQDDAGNSRAKTMEAYGLGTRGDHICLVWKNECYDIHVAWCRISGAFGITFGSSNVAVQILLPDRAPVKNNTYRDAIIERDGGHQPLRVEDFAELVRTNRPRWLVKYIDEEARKNTSQSGVPTRLKNFLDELKAPGENRPAVEVGGDDVGEMASASRTGDGEGADTPYVLDENGAITRPAKGHRTAGQHPGIPIVSFAEDPAILEELAGRAAMYKRDANVVLLNPEHFKYKDDLEKVYDDVGPSADRQALAKKLFDEEYQFNAGKFVILAWLFKGRPNWEDQKWAESLSMGAITVYLAAPETLHEARRRLRQKLNSRKTRDLQ